MFQPFIFTSQMSVSNGVITAYGPNDQAIDETVVYTLANAQRTYAHDLRSHSDRIQRDGRVIFGDWDTDISVVWEEVSPRIVRRMVFTGVVPTSEQYFTF
jgi:hypothetical protein